MTPEVPIGDNVLEEFVTTREYTIKLYVHLGTGGDVLMGGNTTYRLPFMIYANPTIHEWDSVRGFNLYEDQTHIVIQVRIETLIQYNTIQYNIRLITLDRMQATQ